MKLNHSQMLPQSYIVNNLKTHTVRTVYGNAGIQGAIYDLIGTLAKTVDVTNVWAEFLKHTRVYAIQSGTRTLYSHPENIEYRNMVDIALARWMLHLYITDGCINSGTLSEVSESDEKLFFARIRDNRKNFYVERAYITLPDQTVESLECKTERRRLIDEVSQKNAIVVTLRGLITTNAGTNEYEQMILAFQPGLIDLIRVLTSGQSAVIGEAQENIKCREIHESALKQVNEYFGL